MPTDAPVRFYTVGHSTRSLDELTTLLRGCGVAAVADVRTMPRSRRHPQFHEQALTAGLADHGIAYQHIPSLGGLRPRQPDVPDHVNGYWRNRSFHNYADHALGDDFRDGLSRLIDLATVAPCAIMCAEAVWWRCHRRIITDHLLHRGHAVCHILGAGNVQPATLTAAAATDAAGRLIYPAAESRHPG